MIIKIISKNPNFISVLKKNPNSFDGIQLRKIRNGVGIGRIVSEFEYHLVFQDTKYSFSEVGFSQIDCQSYCNPEVFLAMTNNFLQIFLTEKTKYMSGEVSWLNKTNQEIDNFPARIEIENVSISGKAHLALSKYYPNISFKHSVGTLHSYSVECNSVFEAINLTALVMMYLAASNPEPFRLTDELIAKYLKIANNIAPVPYFVMYLFIRKCFYGENLFNKFKNKIEQVIGGNCSLQYGNTQIMRLNFVTDVLLYRQDKIPESNVLEIGCGEMDYPKKLLKYTDNWFAVDKQDYTFLAEKIQERSKSGKLFFSDRIPSFDTDDIAVLMIEVIEHMSKEEAKKLLQEVIKLNPKRIILSTPNRNFNKIYAIQGFRHEDHQFEFSFDEFDNFLNNAIGDNSKYLITHKEIGDVVDNECISLGAILTRV